MSLPKPHYIKDDSGKKVAVVFSMNQYEKILEELEELEDVRVYDQAKKEDDGTRIPLKEYIKKRKARNA
ncbi:MAG: hypothetical protein WD048_16590 [Chitinophagales bacterium]